MEEEGTRLAGRGWNPKLRCRFCPSKKTEEAVFVVYAFMKGKRRPKLHSLAGQRCCYWADFCWAGEANGHRK
jgi:hypothetical protein